MSSNIKINRICLFCKQTFIAKTFRTKYCSHRCNSKHYKQKIKEERLNTVTKKVQIEKITNTSTKVEYNIKLLHTKPYLSIPEVCVLMNISDSTIRKYLKIGLLQNIRIGKKHIIKKSDLENLKSSS